MVAGIPLSLAAATLFQWLTTGEKVLVSRQAVTDLLSYWPLIGASLFFLGGLTFWAWRQEKKRQKQPVNDTTATTLPPAPSITADTYIEQQQIIQQSATTQVYALHQLPPAPGDFTGREAELVKFTNERNNRGLALSGLQGMGGIGKTALGLVVAHRLSAEYPDAQFFLDLKGTTTPLSVTAAMQHVIRAYHPESKFPDTEDEMSCTSKAESTSARAWRCLTWKLRTFRLVAPGPSYTLRRTRPPPASPAIILVLACISSTSVSIRWSRSPG